MALAMTKEDELDQDVESGPMPPSVMRLAVMVRRARERLGWSQRNLAEVAKLNHELVRRIEAGECHPRFGDGIQLLLVLGQAERPGTFKQIAFGQITAAKRPGENNNVEE